MPTKLPLHTYVGYGLGDLGFNLFYNGLSFFLLYYYTDVLGIPPVAAGLSIMAGVVWDAVTDPFMGWLATRTRTRFGRFRPYILFGAPAMCASFILMFAAPLIFPAALILACTLSHMLFRTMYTVVNIPFGALSSVLTRNADTRTLLSAARMGGALIGVFIIASFTLSLATTLGDGNIAIGWVRTSAVYAAIALALMVVVFFTTKEARKIEVEQVPNSIGDIARLLASNRVLWVIFGTIGVVTFSNAIAGKTLIYYMTYNMGLADDGARGGILGLQAFGAAFSVPLWAWLSGRISKRLTWVVGLVFGALTQLSLFLIAPQTAAQISPFVFCAGVSGGATAIIFWSMVPDAVEFGEWRSGVRDEGITFALAAFAQKSIGGFGVGLLGIMLAMIGYVANTEQTPTALEGLRYFAFLVPTIGFFIAAAIVWFHPMDSRRHARLVRAIDYRKTVRAR